MKKLLVAMMLTVTASAGFLVEPYANFRLGSQEKKIDGKSTLLDGTYDYSLSGQEIGARLGYSFIMVMAGIDYNMGTLKSEFDKSSTSVDGSDSDYDSKNLGLFVGVELPILLRGWATYYIDSKLEDDDGDEISGDGLGLGVGFTGLPFVSLNLEYRALSYEDDGIEYDSSEIILGASLPLDL